MTDDIYIIAITALLPVTAAMSVLQVNPYHALVLRGILGAVAALVYVLFGAADVALTEALVGTMLSITLYAVAVRSSMSLRIGVLHEELEMTAEAESKENSALEQTSTQDYPPLAEPSVLALRDVMSKHYLRLEWTTYPTLTELNTALQDKEIHATLCIQDRPQKSSLEKERVKVDLQTRVRRLYNIMTSELPVSANVQVNYTGAALSDSKAPKLVEGQP